MWPEAPAPTPTAPQPPSSPNCQRHLPARMCTRRCQSRRGKEDVGISNEFEVMGFLSRAPSIANRCCRQAHTNVRADRRRKLPSECLLSREAKPLAH